MFSLPEAPNFTRFLIERFGQNLVAQKEESADDRWQVWLIKDQDGEVHGRYRIYGKPGEADYGIEYSGRIPGYVNQATAIYNQSRESDEQQPVDQICLTWRTRAQKIHYQSLEEGLDAWRPEHMRARLKEGEDPLEMISNGGETIPFP